MGAEPLICQSFKIIRLNLRELPNFLTPFSDCCQGSIRLCHGVCIIFLGQGHGLSQYLSGIGHEGVEPFPATF